ncbi:fatty acid--CoA ligase family protein [Gordonia sp. LSe1-13]|uniref:Fatty acid--CoA ligase family protein n=1 Tax=Gordonia sesuvii TaxID=3116777 RepID=A0ABU7M8Z0_9ACTN|nr:fatty acid--CoA ligase family protein [Gordonia sp. LSe1-13]
MNRSDTAEHDRTDPRGDSDFADQLRVHLAGYGELPFIEFERQWYSGDQVMRLIEDLMQVLDHAGIPDTAPIGMVARNRLPHAAATLGLIAARRKVAMIYSYQSAQSIARDIENLGLAAVIADRDDWSDTTLNAARHVGAAAIAVTTTPLSAEPLVDPAVPCQAPGVHMDEPGLSILSSGTTGPPKRLPLRVDILRHTVTSMTMGATGGRDDPPELVYWPFGSVGICQLLAAPFLDKRMVLLEKFSVAEWVRAIKTYGIKRAGVQPALLRMILDADVPTEDLASLESLPGGSGPLEPELREEFESKYGIPLMWAYGATEFAGSVCAWTPDDHRRYGAHKPRSVGRPLPGVRVRVVDQDTGEQLPTDEIGYLEGQVDVIGPDWIRTTDLASIDADGFVYIHGRGDGAINRGGFKILPESVRAELLRHPTILDAAVVGIDDRRLGQVPVAAVELRSAGDPPSEDELKQLVRDALPSHHVPVSIRIVDALPRNAAWKVKSAEVAALWTATH